QSDPRGAPARDLAPHADQQAREVRAAAAAQALKSRYGVKYAIAVTGCDSVTVQVSPVLPAHAPSQPPNDQPVSGASISVTAAPASYSVVHGVLWSVQENTRSAGAIV